MCRPACSDGHCLLLPFLLLLLRWSPQVQEMYAAALADDPNAFAYDGVYESMQQEKAAPKAQDKVVRQPKYIANLLEQAQQRKREQDITNERRLVRCWLCAAVDLAG
eukprot:GHRQ01034190.1.p3 GENE.GHRQ01034190.1~~GHRQ01034190.1.p3  ORF type:complete len:107 (-),score=28.15 GHRQ01034190.1:129-449(-)